MRQAFWERVALIDLYGRQVVSTPPGQRVNLDPARLAATVAMPAVIVMPMLIVVLLVAPSHSRDDSRTSSDDSRAFSGSSWGSGALPWAPGTRGSKSSWSRLGRRSGPWRA